MKFQRLFPLLFLGVMAASAADEGARFIAEGKTSEARSFYLKRLSSVKSDREAASALARLERNAKASMDYLLSVVNASPHDSLTESALLRLSQLHYASGDYTRAVQWLNKLLAEYPQSGLRAEALYWKGLSSLSLNRKDSALLLFGAVPEAEPALYARAQTVSGILFSKEGRYAAADSCLANALTLRDNSVLSSIYYQRSLNLRVLQDADSSTAYGHRLVAEFPGAIEAQGFSFPETAGAAPVSLKGAFTLQLGAFQSRENAEKLLSKIKASIAGAELVIREEKRDSMVLHRVLLGAFANESDAKKFALDKSRVLPKEYKVVKNNP